MNIFLIIHRVYTQWTTQSLLFSISWSVNFTIFVINLAVHSFHSTVDLVRAILEKLFFAGQSQARPQATFARRSPSSRPDSIPVWPTRICVCVGVIQNSPGVDRYPVQLLHAPRGLLSWFSPYERVTEAAMDGCSLTTEIAERRWLLICKYPEGTRKHDFCASFLTPSGNGWWCLMKIKIG